MQDLILTTAQAQAVYSAMCALNAVGGKIETTVGEVLVRETFTGRVSVVSAFDADDRRETYDEQDAFAAAYGLHDAPDGADLLAALKVAHMALVDYPPAPRNSFTDAATEMCRATIARNSA